MTAQRPALEKPNPAYSGDEAFVFVSYAHADAALVYPELRWLQEQGVRLWYDEGISGASRWRDVIAGQIARCRLFVFYVSPNSAASQVCREELEYALDQGRTVLSIHLEPTELPEGMRLAISNRQGLMRYQLPPDDYQRKFSSAISRALELEAIVGDAPMPVVQPGGERRSKWVPALVAGIALGVLLALAVGWLLPEPATTNETYRFDLALTDPPLYFGVNEIGSTLPSLALTVDGSALIYVGRDEDGQFLYRRDLLSGATRRIENTRDAVLPMVSPDNQWLAFFVGNELFRMPLGGGQRSRIAITRNIDHASWGAPDTIAVMHDDGNKISFVSPSQATQAERFEGWTYILPELLPDGERLLITLAGEVVVIGEDAKDPAPAGIAGFSPLLRNGYIMTLTPAGVAAARFDATTGRVTSPVVTLPMSLRIDMAAQWSLGANGLFAYAPGGSQYNQPLAWGHPQGAMTRLPYPAGMYGTFAIAPDGESFAAATYSSAERKSGVSVYSLAEEFARKIPLAEPGYVGDINWLPDGSGLYVSLRRDTDSTASYFYQLNTDVVELVALDLDGMFTIESIDKSGKLLTINTPEAIWLHDRERGESTSLVEDTTAWGSAINPGGDGVAFVSRRSGSYEIYYKLNDGSNTLVQVSRSPGSEEPDWNEDGSRLYYRNGTRIMLVDVLDAKTGRFGRPQVYFEGSFANVTGQSFDIARDESAALVKMLPPVTSEVVHVETDWFDKLESLIAEAERSSR